MRLGLAKPVGFGLFSLGVALTVLCAGCASVQDALRLNRPTARIAGVSLSDISLQSLTLMLDVDVDNPYAVALPLVNVDYGLASRGQSFLAGKADLEGTVPGHGQKRLKVPIQIAYTSVLAALKDVRPGAVIPYDAQLGLSLDAPTIGPIRLPLSRQGEVPIPALPQVELTEIAWRSLSLKEAVGVVRLRCSNPNQFPLQLSTLQYGLSLAGVELAQSSIAESVAFEPNGGSGTIEIPLSFYPGELGVALLNVLRGEGAGYRLRGSLETTSPFGRIAFPVDQGGKTVFRH